MPWFPMKGAIKRLRLERRWSRLELAKKSGVKIRTIREWESQRIPRMGHDDTVKGLAAAFEVDNEQIAEWRDYDPDVADELGDASADAPPKTTLGVRAARDDLREWITTPGGERLELIRPRLLNRIKTAPGLCAQDRYAISGKVREHRDMPAIVGSVLKLDSTVCGQFLVVRRVDNGDVCYASAFSATGAQTARLIDATDAKETITVVVRIGIQVPEKDFKGFIFFQKRGEPAKMHKWCFIIDEVIEGPAPISYGDAPAGGAKKKKPRTRS